MTAKVHPNVAVPPSLIGGQQQQPAVTLPAPAPADEATEPVTLTVWRKSLLFNGRGFTVFDARGDLVFRVDSYASDSRAEVVLMDAAGCPVLTVRRRKLIGLGLGSDQWLVYPGEDTRRLPPLYAVKRAAQSYMRGVGGANKSMAHVAACSPGAGAGAGAGAAAAAKTGSAGGGYEVEGSYQRRRCTVYDERRRAVAEVLPKETVGSDVFKLVVQPGMEVSLAMAVVLALDQMFGKPSLLRSWSS